MGFVVLEVELLDLIDTTEMMKGDSVRDSTCVKDVECVRAPLRYLHQCLFLLTKPLCMHTRSSVILVSLRTSC